MKYRPKSLMLHSRRVVLSAISFVMLHGISVLAVETDFPSVPIHETVTNGFIHPGIGLTKAYRPYPDCHIPLTRMVCAAEILRYTGRQTSAWAWTENDTNHFIVNLVTPAIETFQNDNSHFMNQNNFSIAVASTRR